MFQFAAPLFVPFLALGLLFTAIQMILKKQSKESWPLGLTTASGLLGYFLGVFVARWLNAQPDSVEYLGSELLSIFGTALLAAVVGIVHWQVCKWVWCRLDASYSPKKRRVAA